MSRICLFAILLFSSLVSAKVETVAGIIRGESANGRKIMKLVSGGFHEIVPITPRAIRELNRLEAGDYFYGYGNILDDDILYLELIERVALKKLLGHWKSNELGTMFFSSYDTLTIYLSSITSDSDQPQKIDLKYHIRPSSNSSWSIFLITNEEVLIGRFRFHGDYIKMHFIDETNGEVMAPTTLTRIDTIDQ